MTAGPPATITLRPSTNAANGGRHHSIAVRYGGHA
jgi:hypothetical protein